MHGSEKVNTQSKAKAKGKKKPKKTSEEIIQEAHRKLIAGSFKNAGFVSVPAASEKNFTFRGSTTDFDDVFVFENVIVLCEYTVSKLEDVSTHLKKKKLVYDKIQEYQVEFIEFFSEKFPGFAQAIGTKIQRSSTSDRDGLLLAARG